jgi:hypothetical protein
MNTQITRRQFLTTAAATVTGAAASSLLGARLFAADGPAKRLPVAIQMCSVIPSAKADITATLKALATAGYDGVELTTGFGGFYGLKPIELRKRLDDAGLRCTGGTFDKGNELDGDALKRVADNFTVLGGRYLVQAALAVPKNQVASREAWLRAAERFTEIEQQLASSGLHSGLHNHTAEWKKLEGGQSGWEPGFASTDAASRRRTALTSTGLRTRSIHTQSTERRRGVRRWACSRCPSRAIP